MDEAHRLGYVRGLGKGEGAQQRRDEMGSGYVETVSKAPKGFGWPCYSIVNMGRRAGAGRYCVLVAGRSPVAKPGYYATIERAREKGREWLERATA
jgi:hypothetical protein